MSIWSRSHSDLAKLAKTLQQRNDRTKQRLKQRSSPDGEAGKLRRTRSLSPGILAEVSGSPVDTQARRQMNPKPPVERVKASVGDRQSAFVDDGANTSVDYRLHDSVDDRPNTPVDERLNTSLDGIDKGSTPRSPLSRSFSARMENILHRLKSDESSAVPRITVTSQEPVGGPASEYVSFSTEEASDSVFERTLSVESNSSAPDSAVVQPSANTTSPKTTTKTVHFPDCQSSAPDRFSVSQNTPEKSLPKDGPSCHSESENRRVLGTSPPKGKEGRNGLIQSPDLLGVPDSPRLSARSPNLLRKLTEVTFSFGSTKAERVQRKEHGRKSPAPEHVDTCNVNDSGQKPGEDLKENAILTNSSVPQGRINGPTDVTTTENATDDIFKSTSDQDENEVGHATYTNSSKRPGFAEEPDGGAVSDLAVLSNKSVSTASQITSDVGSIVPVDSSGPLSMPSSDRCGHREPGSHIDMSDHSPSPLSPHAKLTIQNVDLRFVPISAIGIVVSATGNVLGFGETASSPPISQQDAPRVNVVSEVSEGAPPPQVEGVSIPSPAKAKSDVNAADESDCNSGVVCESSCSSVTVAKQSDLQESCYGNETPEQEGVQGSRFSSKPESFDKDISDRCETAVTVNTEDGCNLNTKEKCKVSVNGEELSCEHSAACKTETSTESSETVSQISQSDPARESTGGNMDIISSPSILPEKMIDTVQPVDNSAGSQLHQSSDRTGGDKNPDALVFDCDKEGACRPQENKKDHVKSHDKQLPEGHDSTCLPPEDLRSSSSGIEADCRHSPSPPDPHFDFQPYVTTAAEPDGSGSVFPVRDLSVAVSVGNEAGNESSGDVMTSGSSVFPASPSSMRCVHCRCTHNSQSLPSFHENQYTVDSSGLDSQDKDAGLESEERTVSPVPFNTKEPLATLDHLSYTQHLRYKSASYCTSVGDLKESATFSRSDLYDSETESSMSAVSASVQVTLSDVTERSRWSSRPHKRRTGDRHERSHHRSEKSRYGKDEKPDRREDRRRHRSGKYSPKTGRSSDGRSEKQEETPRSWSSSSVDSLLSVSDSSSSCSAEVWHYLTTPSSKEGERHEHVNRRRLRKFIKHLQNQPDFSLQGHPNLTKFNKTVAELQELCVSLSRHLEQERQQQQREQLQLEQKYLEQIQKLHQQHREQLQQLQQQQLSLQQRQEQVPEVKETPRNTGKHSFLPVSPAEQRSLVPEVSRLPQRVSPVHHEHLSLADLKSQVALDLDQAFLWEDFIEKELLGHEEQDDNKEPVTSRSSDTGADVPDNCSEVPHVPSESEEALSARSRDRASERTSLDDRTSERTTPEDRFSERTSADEEAESRDWEMETPEEAVQKLDEEFDKTLVDMKPHVLQLPHRSDRQKCAVWIKKLCEPPSSGITGRKNRNMYAQLMLHMLKRGNIQGPFDKKPEEGPLQPLPPYMSIYFDEPLDKPDTENEKLPDWVEGELADTIGSSVFRRSHSDFQGNPATSTWVSNAGSSLRGARQRFNAVFYSPNSHRPHTSMGISLDRDPGLSPIRGDARHHHHGYSADDLTVDSRRSPPRALSPSDRERRQLPDVRRNVQVKSPPESRTKEHSESEWSRPLGVTGISTTASFGKSTMFPDDTSLAKPSDKEIAVRTKMIEAKYHEEKLRLQQKHDAAVQKILDRKNSEIEDVKSHYRSKTKELEETITKLERKVQTLVKEASTVRETKDKQIAELKKMVEMTSDSQRNEYEKRLHDMETEFEQQKFELQKLHTRNIQEILDDTNSRLQRMEAEYNQQAASTTTIIRELESRVQQLTGEVDRTLSQRTILEKEKSELQSRFEKLENELDMAHDRSAQLEREHQKKLEQNEHEMRTLRNKTEASLEFLKQEHSIAAAKASDTISDLEQQVDYLKKALKDAEEHRQRQMRETEQVHQQDKLHLENLHDKQVRSMKKELEQLENEMQRKISRLEQLLQDKEAEVQKQKEYAREQANQAEKALEEFKQQVEKNQNQIYSEMKQQMEQVENDLKKSKQAREKQSREFTRQLEEEKYRHEHELQEAKMAYEQEKSQLLHEVHLQKEYATSEHEREMEQLRESHRNEMKSLEYRYKERQEKDSKAMGELESQVVELREELVQANQLRKQQLVELGLLREEEKQKMQRDHEAEVARIKTDAEQQRLELQKMHSAETERLLEKTNERLKSIEKEYTERGKKSAETIAELQATIKQLREDIKRVKENAESRVSEVRSQSEEEKKSLKKQYSSNLALVQHELDSQRSRVHNLERQIQKLEADHEEKITRLKLEQEERMRGMLPAELKQELEDTIDSLKSQVSTLQQRAAMLQEELDLRLKNPLGPFGSRTSSPIKSSV